MIFRAVEDADLVAKTRQGEVEAYNLLIARWESRIFNYLLRIVGSREDALDLSQEVFLKGYQNVRKLQNGSRFGPWLFRIAHNEAYSLFRKNRNHEGEPAKTEPAARGGLPMEMTLAVTAALDRLGPEQREAVVLKIYQGFKFDEMAEILDCPVSTVKSRLYTALDLLRDELAPETKVIAK